MSNFNKMETAKVIELLLEELALLTLFEELKLFLEEKAAIGLNAIVSRFEEQRGWNRREPGR